MANGCGTLNVNWRECYGGAWHSCLLCCNNVDHDAGDLVSCWSQYVFDLFYKDKIFEQIAAHSENSCSKQGKLRLE